MKNAFLNAAKHWSFCEFKIKGEKLLKTKLYVFFFFFFLVSLNLHPYNYKIIWYLNSIAFHSSNNSVGVFQGTRSITRNYKKQKLCFCYLSSYYNLHPYNSSLVCVFQGIGSIMDPLEWQVFCFLKDQILWLPAIVIFTVLRDFVFVRNAISEKYRDQQDRPYVYHIDW